MLSDTIKNQLENIAAALGKPGNFVSVQMILAWEQSMSRHRVSERDFEIAAEKCLEILPKFPTIAEFLQIVGTVKSQAAIEGQFFAPYRCPKCHYDVVLVSESPCWEDQYPCKNPECGGVMITEAEYQRRQVSDTPIDPDIKSRFTKLFKNLAENDPFTVDVPAWARVETVAEEVSP